MTSVTCVQRASLGHLNEKSNERKKNPQISEYPWLPFVGHRSVPH